MTEDPENLERGSPEPAAERRLDRLLSIYEVPEPPPGLERRFWQRFHKARMLGEAGLNDGHALRILRVLGPVAACLVIAFGVWMLVQPPPPTIKPEPQPIAEGNPDGNIESDPILAAAPTASPEDTDAYMDVVVPRPKDERFRGLDLKKLQLLKELSKAEYADLNFGNPDDIPLIDDFKLLRDLDRAEAENG